ncbi:NAD-dependent epimerase/dehydratase family protein [soil metagenome]
MGRYATASEENARDEPACDEFPAVKKPANSAVTAGSGSGLVFMTGATGFIGGRLATALSARGYRLRCLVRRPDRAAVLKLLGAELMTGDVSDEAAMARGVAGVDLAYHVAGHYAVGNVDVAAMERANVEGTRVFLKSVAAAGVPRSVYVSSTVALGPAVDGHEADETQHYTGPYPGEYFRTKTLAHHMARGAQTEGLPLVIVCPAYVYGPGDEGPPMQFMQDVLRHRVPGLSTRPTVYSYVHVDDVVDGLVAAGERGRVGSVYVLGGEPCDVNEFTKRVGRLADTWVSPLRLPPFAVRMTGILLDGVTRLTGWRMPVSRELADMGGRGERWVHSYARAANELDYSPRSLAEGLPDTVRDARERLAR